MRSRISGRLLPAALAAATVTAIGVPASAQEAPPLVDETYSYSEAECAEALKILSYFKLLPDQPDIGRILCSIKAAQDQAAQNQAEAPQDGTQQVEYINEIEITYTTGTGKTVEDTKLLGHPVEWPKSITIHVPTIKYQWHSYTPSKN